MNLLYEDINNRTQEDIETYTNQIEKPKTSFDEYIANIKRGMGEESEDPNPNPTPAPSKGEGREGGSRNPNPHPNPNPNPNPNETPSSYGIGLITQHDNEIHDNDIIMNTIADSGADIDDTL